MNIHKNARTTPQSRAEIVRRVVRERQPARQVAAAFGISERTVRKWVARDRPAAPAALADRSSRPHSSPGQTPVELRELIARLRRQRWTGAEIARALDLSPATVARYLRRQGLARLRTLEPPVPVVRYEYQRPGGLVHVDIKKLGRIGRVGHRISGDRRSRVRGIGWEFVHVAVDDATAWRTSRSSLTSRASRVCGFSGAPWPGFAATASGSAGS
jgi:transposase